MVSRLLIASRAGAMALALALGWGSFQLGCSSSGGTGVSLDELSAEMVEAECALHVRCHVFSDTHLCRQAFAFHRLDAGVFASGWMAGFNPITLPDRADFNSLAAIVASARAGKARYDAAAAKACLDAIRGLSCTDMLVARRILADVCQPVFTGKLADGDRCITDLACGPHSYCAVPISGSSCDGTCSPAGPACNADRQCPTGQSCEWKMQTPTSKGTCVATVPPGAAGELCGTSDLCQAGLICSSGMCVAAPSAGEPCLGGFLFFSCAPGLACVTTPEALTCREPAMKGGNCETTQQCGGLFTTLTCDPATKTCVDWQPDLCNNPPHCPYGSYCDDTSHCVVNRPEGSTCNTGSDECGLIGRLGTDCRADAPASTTGICTSVWPPTCSP